MRWAAGVKHYLWAYLGGYCWALPLFELYRLATGRGIGVVDKQTDIVIEGYPRSANTMAVSAFEMVQNDSVKIAHHVHGAAQVLWAVRNRIPVMVLIRKPIDAVASLAVRYPEVSLKQALQNYIRFYKAIEPVKRDCVIAAFDDVVSRYHDVITTVNAKYGTHFVQFIPTASNMDQCFARIDELDKSDQRSVHTTEATVARPNSSRHGLTEVVRLELAEEKFRRQIAEANLVYEKVLAN